MKNTIPKYHQHRKERFSIDIENVFFLNTQSSVKSVNKKRDGIDSRVIEGIKNKLKEGTDKELIRDSFGNDKKRKRLTNEITNIISSKEFVEEYKLKEKKLHEYVNQIVEKLVGLDVLEELRKDSGITDISVISSNNIWIDHIEKGDVKVPIQFEDEQAYLELLNRFAFASDKTFSYGSPSFDAMFPQIRVNVVGYDLSKTPTLQMRIISKNLRFQSKEEIIGSGFIDEIGYELLKRTIPINSHLIGGETGSGKTEFLRYLTRYKTPGKPLIMIEDNPEAYLDEIYPNEPIKMWVNRTSRGSENQEYGYQYHARNAMRHNPKYIYFQESRGGEALEIQKCVTTGHVVNTTLHSKSAVGSIDRFIDLCQEGKMQSSETYGKRLTGEDGFRIGIHVARFESGRKANELFEYRGYENGVATGNMLVKYNPLTNRHEVVSPMSKELWDELATHHKGDMTGLEQLSPYKAVAV